MHCHPCILLNYRWKSGYPALKNHWLDRMSKMYYSNDSLVSERGPMGSAPNLQLRKGWANLLRDNDIILLSIIIRGIMYCVTLWIKHLWKSLYAAV